MKRLISFAVFGFGAVVLGGCPIYSDSHDSRYCDAYSCYDCPENAEGSSACLPWQCNTSSECPSGWSCDGTHRCDPPTSNYDAGVPTGTTCAAPSDCGAGQTCGADDRCHAGDCASSGCPSGYVCKLANGVATCASTGTTDAGVSDGAADASVDAGPPICKTDSECAAKSAGAKCLDGTCVNPVDQCSDATQCPNGEQCVQGGCTPSCDGSHACPTGYACDTSKGVCTVNPGVCASNASCSAGTVCVEQHCVTECGDGGACGSGLVCVGGGCQPAQTPIFTCATEGVRDACASGSICLHHNCYIACTNDDAGADAGNACKSADKFNVCKSVTTGSGTYSVCGSTSNLGTDCDPTQGKSCTGAGQICIDGFCR